MTPYALFDFDGTLRKSDTIIDFCWYAYQHKLCTLWQLIKGGVMGALFLCGVITAKQSKEVTLAFLKGHSKEEIQKHAKCYCQTKVLPKVYPEGIEAMQNHQKQGHKVLIITASPSFYLEPLIHLLPVDGLIGTRVAMDENNRYTGHMLGENCRGQEKTIRFASYLKKVCDTFDPTASTAYGDTAGDYEMLALCDHIVAVNPKPKLLRKLAHHQKKATVVTWGSKGA